MPGPIRVRDSGQACISSINDDYPARQLGLVSGSRSTDWLQALAGSRKLDTARSRALSWPLSDWWYPLSVDFRLTEEQELLRRSVREFAETEIRPHVREWDEAQHFPDRAVPKLAALGLIGIQLPEQYGGAGMSAIDYCICIEELARVDPARRAVGRRAQRPLLGAHLAVRHRGAEAAVPRAAGARREDRRVGADRVDLRQRRRRHADDGDARRRRAGC